MKWLLWAIARLGISALFLYFKFSALEATRRRVFLLRDGAAMDGNHEQLVGQRKDKKIAERHNFWQSYAGPVSKNEFCRAG